MAAGVKTFARKAFATVLAVMLVAGLSATGLPVTELHAQEQQQERSSGGLLRFLFGGGDQRTRVREAPPVAEPAQPARRASQPRRQEAARPAAVPKSENASKVLVIGDFAASGLAEGLEAAYAENPDVRVVARANGASGLVRNDFFDWPGRLDGIVEEVEPDFLVVMIGGNDRQQMNVAGRREEPRSEAWLAEYERRAARLAAVASAREIPLFWVGMVSFRFRSMSSDMLAFNDIYRRVAEDAGGEYVDVWGGFVDEENNYIATGPDMNGHTAQLRASDGINFTAAGKRKIAFYVEKPLNRLIGEAPAAEPVRFGPAVPDDFEPVAVGPDTIERTQPFALVEPRPVDEGELLGSRVRPVAARQAGTRPPAVENIEARARPGRADDFSRRNGNGSATR